MRRAQAMVETVIALVVITFVMTVCFTLMHALFARTMLDHASRRAARARAVGLNDFMCLKSARAAMIPVAGRRTWPEGAVDEVSRIPGYLMAEYPSSARGVLDYELWPRTTLDVQTHYGLAPEIAARMTLERDDFTMDGAAEIEAHYPLYMEGAAQ